MDEIVWVEILSRHRDVASRHRCAGATIRIGRAYDNDVVIDDPHVAPHHLRIARDVAGQWVAEDLGSLNGLFVGHAGGRRDHIILDGDRAIRIGHTYLRVRDVDHPVMPERAAGAEPQRWPFLVALGAAALAASALSLWLTEIAEPKLSRYLLPLLALPVLTLGWSAGWATLSRIFSGQARFERNLLITLAGFLVYWLYQNAFTVLGFGLAWRSLAIVQDIGIWCLLGALVFLHLRVIGPTRLWLKAATAAGLSVIVIAMRLAGQADPFTGADQQTLLRNFMPPALRLTAPHNESAFFGDVERLKRRLDQDRTDETAAVSFGGPAADDHESGR
jgi:hypothetical protein